MKHIFNGKTLLMAALMVGSLSCSAFAADGFDLTTTVTTSVTEIAEQLMSIIGVVVTGVVGFFGAKLAINKAFSFIKTMVGKA